MLRVVEGGYLCDQCHRQVSGSTPGQSYGHFSGKAHYGSINPESRSMMSATSSGEDIDEESRTCVSCHEDVTVTVPGFNETGAVKAARWSKMKDHPIGMDYSRVAMRDFTEYHYPPREAERIRMFDGKVGCGSCHSIYSGVEKLLVVHNDRSYLCRQCHNR